MCLLMILSLTTCIAARSSASSAIMVSLTSSLVEGIFMPNGLPSGLHLVPGKGSVPCWKYARAALAVQSDGDDHEVCFGKLLVPDDEDGNM